MSDMHASNVRRIERGEANPGLSTMARLAVALDVQLAELVVDIPPQIMDKTEEYK